jgi:hypothetical protein
VLFEPIPIETSRSGRLRGLVAITIPVVMLVGVVGIAALGPHDATGTTRQAAAPGAMATGVPAGAGSSSRPAAATNDRATIGFPVAAFDLRTQTVGQVADRMRLSADPAGDLVAIRGWLSIRPEGASCAPALGPPRLQEALCWASGILRDDPAPALRWVTGELRSLGTGGVHLHPQFPPGVSLWGIDVNKVAPSSRGLLNGPIEPVPVVLIGRLQDPRVGPCPANGRDCNESFVVERLVWADGAWLIRPVVEAVGPDLTGLDATQSRQIALDAFPGPSIVLSQALVPGSMLERLDPVAAARSALASGVDQLWYLRVMLPAPNDLVPVRSVRWITIDGGNGSILGSQPVP